MPGVDRAALQGDLSQPQDWQQVGQVSKLYIYPVKSLANVPVENFTTGPWAAEIGAMVDRQLMVLDRKDKMVTARKYPHMTLVQPLVQRASLTLSYPGMQSVTVNLPDTDSLGAGNYITVDVFGDLCHGLDLGEEVGRWLSDVILSDPEAGMKLIYHPKGDSSRPDKKPDDLIHPTWKPQDKPYFADGFPYMMMTQPSLDELNRKLEEEGVDLKVEERRFRPNILVSGTFPAFL